MYIITIMFNDRSTHSIVTHYGSPEKFFNVIWIIENSPHVKSFTVSDASGVMSQDSFCYGEIKKWVTKFNYRSDNAD